MKKKVLVLIAFLFSSLPSQLSIINCQFSIANALPAQRGVKRTVPQADGTKLTLNLRGDEHLHYFTADNGLPVVRNAVGNYCYAEVRAEGLVPTSQLVTQPNGSVSRVSDASPTHLSKVQQDLRLLRQQRMKNVERTPMPRRVMTGQRRGLVILAEYANYPYTYSKATMDSIMNYTGYQKGYFQGSVHDYFLEQSNGQFDLTFDVVGPVKLSKDMEYYGQNNIFGDVHVGQMVAEACQLATDSVNYADYDWDGDGKVDQVVVIYAGWGEAMGAAEETIWPQENQLSKSDFGRPLKIDGVEINKYATTCELYGNEEAYGGERWLTGVGPMCHEFSHCFGLPDFYDTLDDLHFTMCDWDLMDSGCYNLGTYCPAGYTGYEKWFCGWQEPIVLDSPQTITNQQPLSEGGDFYVVYNDQYSGQKNEYYILENRQWTGFDSWLYGKGLLITHVNYSAAAWRNNEVNNEYGKERMAIIPANNLYTYKDSAEIGNTYPYIDRESGTILNDALTNTSTPSAMVFNVNKSFKKTMDKPITDIRMDADTHTTSFRFMGGSDDEATGIGNEELRMKNEELRMKDEESRGGIYDLLGRPVSYRANSVCPTSPKSIYIIRSAEGRLQGKNGKKIMN